MEVRPIFKLIRPHNCILAGIGVLIGSTIALEDISLTLTQITYYRLTFAFLTAVLVSGAGNAINDYADRELDAVNNPERPIPAGKISPSKALLARRILFSVGIVSAALIGNLFCFLLAVVNSGLLALYASRLKREGLVGILTISYLVGSTFLFGGLAAGGFQTVWILAAMAGFSTAGRELIKDIEDIRGDKESEGESFPLKVGGKKAAALAIILTGIAIALTPLPYWFGLFGELYLVVVAVSIAVFITGMITIGKNQSKKSASRASLIYKVAMGFGLAAFLLGALF